MKVHTHPHKETGENKKIHHDGHYLAENETRYFQNMRRAR
jgi:hypothetical protein